MISIKEWDQDIFTEAETYYIENEDKRGICSTTFTRVPTLELYNPQTIKKDYIVEESKRKGKGKIARSCSCFYPDTFIFESDSLEKELQLSQALDLIGKFPILSITDSGSKSIHIVVKILYDKQLEDKYDIMLREPFWFKKVAEKMSFLMKLQACDKASWNINRFTRTPNAIRKSNGNLQECYYYKAHERMDISNILESVFNDRFFVLSQEQIEISQKQAYNGPEKKYDSIEGHLKDIVNRSQAYYNAVDYINYSCDWSRFLSAISYLKAIGHTYEEIKDLGLEGKWDLKKAFFYKK